MKLTVTYTYPNEEGKKAAMLFDETLVRQACKLNGCDDDLMEDCIANMREEIDGCTDCYLALVLHLDAEPEYKLGGKNDANNTG